MDEDGYGFVFLSSGSRRLTKTPRVSGAWTKRKLTRIKDNLQARLGLEGGTMYNHKVQTRDEDTQR